MQAGSQQGLLQQTRRRKRREIQLQRALHSDWQQLLGQQSLTQGVQVVQLGLQVVQAGVQVVQAGLQGAGLGSTQTGARRHLQTGTSWQTLTLTFLQQVVGTHSVTVYGTLQWVV